MHFHYASICMNCRTVVPFSTPIPNILLLADMCPSCGWNDLVGRDGNEVCASCRQQWADDTERENHWGRFSRA